jgi:tubulysin polyketide synthase-like protein
MSAAITKLLSECSAAGVELFLAHGRLRYRAQPGAYTEDLRQRVAVHRDAVIAALTSRPVTLDLTLAAVTAGLPITAEQFRSFLSQEDLADIAAGLIPVECLRAYAERFSKRPPVAVDNDRVRCADCAHFERIDRPHVEGSVRTSRPRWRASHEQAGNPPAGHPRKTIAKAT